VKFDKSGYAALGWSIVSFGLQIVENTKDARKFALSSSKFITEYMTRYAQYEKWFRRELPDEEFDRLLVEVYKTILLCLMVLDDYLQLCGPSSFSKF
jgi:hypothetical protein